MIWQFCDNASGVRVLWHNAHEIWMDQWFQKTKRLLLTVLVLNSVFKVADEDGIRCVSGRLRAVILISVINGNKTHSQMLQPAIMFFCDKGAVIDSMMLCPPHPPPQSWCCEYDENLKIKVSATCHRADTTHLPCIAFSLQTKKANIISESSWTLKSKKVTNCEGTTNSVTDKRQLLSENAVFEWDCALMRLSEINMMEADLTQTTKTGAASSKWRLLRWRNSFHIISALCDSVFAAFFFFPLSLFITSYPTFFFLIPTKTNSYEMKLTYLGASKQTPETSSFIS